jgi:cytochrome c
MKKSDARRVGERTVAGAHAQTLARRTARARWLVAILPALLALPAHAAGDAARGEQKFVECGACHSLKPGVAMVGPSLSGLFGRKAGSLTDFRYSPAMRRSGITWDAQALDAFLADPQKAVPANRMPYAGLTDAAARADLVAYLEKATKP